jgi:mRNA interferase RelE/StbE
MYTIEITAKKIYSVREHPFSFLKKLRGNQYWRLRIDDYRAIVDVVVVRRKVIVLRIGHRKNVYD